MSTHWGLIRGVGPPPLSGLLALGVMAAFMAAGCSAPTDHPSAAQPAPALDAPTFSTKGWRTDFSNHSGTTSALNGASIPDSVDGGATGIFSSGFGNRQLTFRAGGTRFVDSETGSRWDLLGRAVSGPLLGGQLETLVHGDYFWFAWAAFKPGTRIYEG